MKYFSCTQDNFIRTVTLEELGCDTYIIDSPKLLEEHLESMKILIQHFNSYIQWDKMFNLEDIVERVKKGIILILTYYKDNPVGYIFVNNGWVYNLFVSKLNTRPNKTFLSLCNRAFELAIDRFGIIAWECEDWNKPMFYVATQSGCKEENFSRKQDLVT